MEAHRQEAGTWSARSQPYQSRTAEEPGPRGQPEPAPHSQAFAGRLGLGPRPPQGAPRSPVAGRSPASLSEPQWTLRRKSPKHQAPHARTPRVHGEREEGPGPAGALVWLQTYQALRAPLPPPEDAPPPPPCRAGSGREARCEGAEIGSAPAPVPRGPGLGSPRCAGAAR